MALVLTRKEGTKIILTLPSGETISVLVQKINGTTVQLSVAAPLEVKILRGELAS